MNLMMAIVSGVAAGLVVLGMAASLPVIVYAGAVCALPPVVAYWLQRRRREREASAKENEKHSRMRRALGVVGHVAVPREVRWAVDTDGLNGVMTAGEGLSEMAKSPKREYRRESFEQAVERFGLSDRDVLRIAKALRLRGRIFVGGFYCCTAIFVGAAIATQLLWVCATLMAMWTFTLAAAQSLFRAKQCELGMFISPASYFHQHFLNDANPLRW